MKTYAYKGKIPFLIVVMVLCLFCVFYTGNYYYGILNQIACYFVAIVGLNFITGMTGQPMLGMAGVYAIGAYTTGLLTTKLGFTAWQALPFVLLAGLIIGLILGYPSLRLSGVYLSFTTIAFSEIVRTILLNATTFTGGGSGLKNIPDYYILGRAFHTAREKFFIFGGIAIIVAILASYIVNSKWGKNFLAIRDNIDAVPACGINVTNNKLLAFCLATILGSLGGSMYAHMSNYINPSSYTQTMSVTMLSMLIIGGMGSVWGCLIGCTAVVFLPEFFRFLGQYYNLAYAVLMLVLIVIMPCGLINLFKRIDRKKEFMKLIEVVFGRRS